MTYKQFAERMSDLRNAWATDSNDTTNQTRLFELCETFITDMDSALEEVGAHPDPPPPRVR